MPARPSIGYENDRIAGTVEAKNPAVKEMPQPSGHRITPGDRLRPELLATEAYAVAEVPDQVLRLDAMESPWNCAEAFADDWQHMLSSVSINRYPSGEANRLEVLLRSRMDIPQRWELLTGNGSDDLINILLSALGGPGRTVVAPEPGFSMIPLLARAGGSDYHGVPLRNDFSLDTERFCATVRDVDAALSFLALPNNPTGNLFNLESIEAILEAAPGVVVLDEAYLPFASRDHLNLLQTRPGVLILRTLSKIGLAGLRIGLLIGADEWLQQLRKLRLPYTIGTLNLAAACVSLQHYDSLLEWAARLRAEREWLYRHLAALPELSIWPSEANFLLLRVPQAPAVFSALLKAGILVRNLHGSHPLLANCLRVTVSERSENQRFVAALKFCLGAAGR